MRDWVPMAFYGQNIQVGPGVWAFSTLYPIPDLQGSTAEFLVEDEEEQSLFIERIVGTIDMFWLADDGINTCAWRLLPLGADFDAPGPLLPMATNWAYDSEWANLRWWDERYYLPAATGAARPQEVDHPYWTHVDLHPRQLMGMKRNLWPTLAMWNGDLNATLVVHHRLRAYYK